MYEIIFRKIVFPILEKVLNSRNTCSYLKEYEQQQWWDKDRLHELQLQKLKKLLAYAERNVPYYRDTWGEIGFSSFDVNSVEDIKELPFLTKDIIKANYKDLIAIPHRSAVLEKSTGGSTGVPLKFSYTNESYSRRNAVMWRGYTWAGLPPGKKAMYIWGTNFDSVSHFMRAKDVIFNRLYNRSILSCFNLTEENMCDFISEINKKKPPVVVSYVNPVYLLAKWVSKNGQLIHKPLSIITGAEPLLEYQRSLIEEVFGCKVFNTFGCREVMLIASECDHKSGMHINIDHLVVESVGCSGESVIDGVGDLVVTDLHNYGMPFIRYKNEDLVKLSSKSCSCGRGLPLMGKVEGRVLDCIRTPNGRVLPGEFFPHFFKDYPSIEKFQVIQEELTIININLVVNSEYSAQEQGIIINKITDALGNAIKVDVNIMSDIPTTSSGKHRVTISKI